MSDVLYDDFTTDQAAYGDSNEHIRTCSPGPGTLSIRFAPTSSVSGGSFSIIDSNLFCREETDRTRRAGRIHRFKFTTRTGSGHAYQFGLARASLGVSGPVYPGFENKVGALRMHDGASYQLQIEDELDASAEHYICIVERVSGGMLVQKIDSDYHLLYPCHVSTESVCLGAMNGGAVNFGIVDFFRVHNTAFVVRPTVSHTFSEGNTSSIGASDGLAVEENGGSGVTPTEAGNNLEVASQRLALSEDGTGYLVWETSQADVHTVAKLTPHTGSPAALVLRYQDSSNCWVFKIDADDDTLKIIERNAGTETTRATATLTEGSSRIDAGTEYLVHATSYGNTLRLFLANMSDHLHDVYLSYTSASFLDTATKHGIRLTKGSGATTAKARSYAAWTRRIAGFPSEDYTMSWSATDNFDSYTAGQSLSGLNGGTNWSAGWVLENGTCTVETAPSGGQGGLAAKFSSASASRFRRHFTAITAGTCRLRLRISNTSPNDFVGFMLQEGSGTSRVLVKIDAGNLKAWNNSTYVTVGAVSVDTWYMVDVEFDDTSQPNTFRVRIDQGTWTSWLTVNGATYTEIDNLRLVDDATNALDFWVDDIGDGADPESAAAGISYKLEDQRLHYVLKGQG